MKVLQINLNRCKAAMEILEQTVIDEKIDLVIASEPYKKVMERNKHKWTADANGDTGIWIVDNGLIAKTDRTLISNGIVGMKVGKMSIFSVYFSPNKPIEEFNEFLKTSTKE